MKSIILKLGLPLAIWLLLLSQSLFAIEEDRYHVCQVHQQILNGETVVMGDIYFNYMSEDSGDSDKVTVPQPVEEFGNSSWLNVESEPGGGNRVHVVATPNISKDKLPELAMPVRWTINVREKEDKYVNHHILFCYYEEPTSDIDGKPRTTELKNLEVPYVNSLCTQFGSQSSDEKGWMEADQYDFFAFQKNKAKLKEEPNEGDVLCAEINILDLRVDGQLKIGMEVEDILRKLNLNLSAKCDAEKTSSKNEFDYCLSFDGEHNVTKIRLYIHNVIKEARYDIKFGINPPEINPKDFRCKAISIKYSITLRNVTPYILVPDSLPVNERKNFNISYKIEKDRDLEGMVQSDGDKYPRKAFSEGKYHEFDIIRTHLPFIAEWKPIIAFEYPNSYFDSNKEKSFEQFVKDSCKSIEHLPVVFAFGCGGLEVMDAICTPSSSFQNDVKGVIFTGVPFYGLDFATAIDVIDKSKMFKKSLDDDFKSFRRLKDVGLSFDRLKRGSEYSWNNRNIYKGHKEFLLSEQVKIFYGLNGVPIIDNFSGLQNKIENSFNSAGFKLSTGASLLITMAGLATTVWCPPVGADLIGIGIGVAGFAVPYGISKGAMIISSHNVDQAKVLASNLSTYGDGFVSAFSSNLPLNLDENKSASAIHVNHEELTNIPFINYNSDDWKNLYETFKSFSE